MEPKLNSRFALLTIAALALSGCNKNEETAETADKRFIQSMEWNNSHSYREIVIASDDYLILSMGDSHVGGTNNLDRFCNIAETRNASAVVMAGDLTTGKEKDYAVFEKHLPSRDRLTCFLIAGNHDLFSNGWKEFQTRFGTSSYIFTIQTPAARDLFICLETAGGTLGTRQLNWLLSILQTSRQSYRHCMVFTHNNLIRTRHTDSTNPPVEEVEVLLDLFTRHDVNMAITGHDHKQDAFVFGKTTYIIMDALKDGENNAGYLMIKVNNSNIGYSFEKI